MVAGEGMRAWVAVNGRGLTKPRRRSHLIHERQPLPQHGLLLVPTAVGAEHSELAVRHLHKREWPRPLAAATRQSVPRRSCRRVCRPDAEVVEAPRRSAGEVIETDGDAIRRDAAPQGVAVAAVNTYPGHLDAEELAVVDVARQRVAVACTTGRNELHVK